MSNQKSRVQAQLDTDLVNQANETMQHLGLNPTTLINLTYQQLVHDQALPFTPHYDVHNINSKIDVNTEWLHRSTDKFDGFTLQFDFLHQFSKSKFNLMQRAHLTMPFNKHKFETDLEPAWRKAFSDGAFINKVAIENYDLKHQHQNLAQISQKMMTYLESQNYTDVVILQNAQLDQNASTNWLIYIVAETPLLNNVVDKLKAIALS